MLKDVQANENGAADDDTAKDDTAKIVRMFRWVLSRPPSQSEIDSLLKLLNANRKDFANREEQSRKLATEPIGPLPQGLSAPELASWVLVGNVILNLDEFLMTP